MSDSIPGCQCSTQHRARRLPGRDSALALVAPTSPRNPAKPEAEFEDSDLVVRHRARKTAKRRAEVARARASGGSVSSGNTQKLDDLLSPYLAQAVQAWVEGLKATKLIWNQSTHRFEDTGFPDHKERRESAQKIVEYLVGKAIERSLEITGSYSELSDVLKSLEQSPEARRLLNPELFDSLRKACSAESAPGATEKKTISDSSQNSG